jgi:hypothetical protein
VTDEDEEDEDWTEERARGAARTARVPGGGRPSLLPESAAAAAGARFSSLRDLALSNELFDVDGYVCYFSEEAALERLEAAIGHQRHPTSPLSVENAKGRSLYDPHFFASMGHAQPKERKGMHILIERNR